MSLGDFMPAMIRVRIGDVNTQSLISQTYNQNMDFKQWLASEIEARGISQAELARLSKVPQPTIQRILSGETGDPRGSTIDKLRHALGASNGGATKLISNISKIAPLDPVIADLSTLEPEQADMWRDRLIEAEARIKRIKSEIRAAAKQARQQQEAGKAGIADPPPLYEERRIQN